MLSPVSRRLNLVLGKSQLLKRLGWSINHEPIEQIFCNSDIPSGRLLSNSSSWCANGHSCNPPTVPRLTRVGRVIYPALTVAQIHLYRADKTRMRDSHCVRRPRSVNIRKVYANITEQH